MKWINEKETLFNFVYVENKSYEEIGRFYGCSSQNIRKVLKKLGFDLPKRRIINEKERQEINEKLNSFFDISETKDWFSNKYKIVNERTILTPNGEKYRPDKILIGTDNVKVIDYKFGEEKNPKYERQIRHYMELLKDMGYTNISGNIYYASTNTIETF